MKYNHLVIILFTLGTSISSHAMQEPTIEECIAYINDTPLSKLITKESLLSGFANNGTQLSYKGALCHFSTLMDNYDINQAFEAKLEQASDEEYIEAKKIICNFKPSPILLNLLNLSYHEEQNFNAAFTCLSNLFDKAKRFHNLNTTSNPTLATTPRKQKVKSSASATKSAKASPTLKQPSSTPIKKPVRVQAPVIVPIEQRLDCIYRYQLSDLCSYQKLSSGYSETNTLHSVENIISLIRDPQILQALQEKYRAASSADRAKAEKNLTRCQKRIAKSRTLINEACEFDSFIQSLRSSDRLSLQKSLLIGSIVTGGLLFAAYAVYNKYYKNTQSHVTTD